MFKLQTCRKCGSTCSILQYEKRIKKMKKSLCEMPWAGAGVRASPGLLAGQAHDNTENIASYSLAVSCSRIVSNADIIIIQR